MARVEPSPIFRVATCPSCGSLLWFTSPKPTRRRQSTRRRRQRWSASSDDVSVQFDGATTLIETGDLVAAVGRLRECVTLAPDHLAFRQRLRETEYKLSDRDRQQDGWTFPRGSLRMVEPVWFGAELDDALDKEEWWYVDWLCEFGLSHDPCNVRLNECVGLSAEKAGYLDVATFGYLCAFRANPRRAGLKEKLESLGHKVLA
jgi:hypothetical protein